MMHGTNSLVIWSKQIIIPVIHTQGSFLDCEAMQCGKQFHYVMQN